MDIIIYLIPIALFLGLVGLGAFLWSLKSGQYDDLDGASYRALFEEDDMAAEQQGKEDKLSKTNGIEDNGTGKNQGKTLPPSHSSPSQ
ncbi:cbb3-type cytochrome oxidase assembly protein CcoS [Luteithermobacter gelatinilyticus]|uniref:cbb3-type cytochrome oxidase assembly protein CcoS n=1 Tax=Luteithermobacter gelatinilyticus TaxID=2582913 RepID=UPI001106792F|nr:cbb3-type cytochrome oxidase assembly protein CcoS [Luteithermobacter gelatinilyticus]|tara:strand:- start:3236 stop:3499 length:264 start_codon:yes stop_codon:yes gene_type:complete